MLDLKKMYNLFKQFDSTIHRSTKDIKAEKKYSQLNLFRIFFTFVTLSHIYNYVIRTDY